MCCEGSSGTFLRADEDKTRSLEEVEEKMARATMIPRNNGEVCVILLALKTDAFCTETHCSRIALLGEVIILIAKLVLFPIIVLPPQTLVPNHKPWARTNR